MSIFTKLSIGLATLGTTIGGSMASNHLQQAYPPKAPIRERIGDQIMIDDEPHEVVGFTGHSAETIDKIRQNCLSRTHERNLYYGDAVSTAQMFAEINCRKTPTVATLVAKRAIQEDDLGMARLGENGPEPLKE